VVSFPPQPVITEDNLVVSIDTVIYYQVTQAKSATYEIANYIQGIEQLTVTTLRNVIGGMDLERTLTSREEINAALRGVLDEATGKWGIRVNRVELKAIDPPPSIQDSMEKQMRADRDKRAAILAAEGERQAAILPAEGDKQSAVLRAQGDREAQILRAQADREAAILRAEGEAQAIGTVFDAVHVAQPDQAMLSYQYLRTLPELAHGEGNTVWVVPSELTRALDGLGGLTGRAGPVSPRPSTGARPATPDRTHEAHETRPGGNDLGEVADSVAHANEQVAQAIAAAEESTVGGEDAAGVPRSK
jgi:regulator of protease activity HflC (stomatin/prohibitin superfamily)